jgi:glutathione S-transferase
MLTAYVFGNVPAPVRPVTRDLRVLWTLEEIGIPYRIQPLDFFRGELKSPEYLRVQPFGQIPAIDDDGFVLFESAAIVLYLAEKARQLLPPDRQGRALVTQWAFAAVNSVEPELAQLFVLDHFAAHESWAKERRPAIVERAEAKLARLESVLAKREYLVGDAFSAADLLMAHVLRLAQHTGLLSAAPSVAAHQARCEARTAWRKVIAEHERRLAA